MTDHIGELCEFLFQTTFDDLPQAVVERGRQVTADTIAAIVGGSEFFVHHHKSLGLVNAKESHPSIKCGHFLVSHLEANVTTSLSTIGRFLSKT